MVEELEKYEIRQPRAFTRAVAADASLRPCFDNFPEVRGLTGRDLRLAKVLF
jgi:hypothetical protein